MRFEWDPEKDKVNRAKHGLSLGDSTELFKSGVDYLEIYDKGREDDVLRLLSARMATRNERRLFEAYEKDRHD